MRVLMDSLRQLQPSFHLRQGACDYAGGAEKREAS